MAAKIRKWESIVSKPLDRKVFQALGDPAWDFRTVSGLARDCHCSESEVEAILDQFSQLVRQTVIPDPKGRKLYTLSSRRVGGMELLGWARTLISKSFR